MIQKFRKFQIQNSFQIKGGETTEETNVNRAKSASKMHDKITQYISS